MEARLVHCRGRRAAEKSDYGALGASWEQTVEYVGRVQVPVGGGCQLRERFVVEREKTTKAEAAAAAAAAGIEKGSNRDNAATESDTAWCCRRTR